MARGLSCHCIGLMNAITAVLSLTILGTGIWLATRTHANDCMKFLQWPFIILGMFVLVVSLAGLYGSCCRVTCLLWFYGLVMLLLIILIFCFTVFALVVTNKGAGDAVSGKGFKEFHLGNYSSWLQRQIQKDSVWDKIKSCLADTDTCKKLDSDNATLVNFVNSELSPIDSGCCKPPDACGYGFVNATTWTNSSSSTLSADPDCSKWSNDQSRLCYDCDACKAAVLQTVKSDWRKVAIVNAVIVGLVFVLYTASWCDLRRNRRRDKDDI